MNMEIKIDEFEGPLDLLLHLIKENKMDIMNIEIEKIVDQYMSYIALQEKLNLEVASEYLVMASELIEIKSKMLLPVNKENEEEEEEEDPREELVNRLLEYQAYKEITKIFQEKENLRKEVYTKSPESVKKYIDEGLNMTSNVSLDDLLLAFQKYLERKKDSKPLKTKVTVNEISVSSRRHDIRNILKKRGKVSFFELFEVATKEYVIATFLAVLEMAKNGELIILQDNTFSDIVCEVTNNE